MKEQSLSLEEIASKQNYYANHLAEVNKNNDVIATQDIYNETGLLVATKGSHINRHAADLIVQHRLLQPLEEQVRLNKSLNSCEFIEGYKSLMAKYPDAKQVHSSTEFEKMLEWLLEGDIVHPIFLQELTVMSEQLPDYYEKTLFCAWMSALIARELGMLKDLIRETFVAGLTRDIGFLHIFPDILRKQETLSSDEWRALQSHVIIGHVMLKKLYNINSPAAKAVLEHHERCDGNGYPVGKTADQLGIVGQIIAVSDSIQAIRINNFAKYGRNLRDILPYLKMNKYTHFLKIYNAICSILKKSSLKPSGINLHGDMQALLSSLLSRGDKLKDAIVLMKEELVKPKYIIEGDNFIKISMAARNVSIMADASGLVNGEILDWLEKLQNKNEEADLVDLIEMELMQNELYWQIENICRIITECLEKDGNFGTVEHRESLKQLSGRLIEILAG